MTTLRTRAQVVQKVGDVLAKRAPTVTDGRPAHVLAEGSVRVELAEGSTPVALVDQTVEATNFPRRRLWPWAAGAAAVALVGTFGYWLYSTDAQRAKLESQYPIVATAADTIVLDREAARWRAGRDRLLANLAAFDAPAVEAMTGVGACPVATATSGATTVDDAGSIDADAAITTRLMLLPGEQLEGLDVVARPEIDAMITAAERGRFRTVEARAHVLEAMRGAFVVARLHTFAHGVAAGTAYAFDPATGGLRCAGTFHTVGDPAQIERDMLGSLRAVATPL